MSDEFPYIFKKQEKNDKKLVKIAKKSMFSKFFYKTEAGHVLKMFLTFRPISASRSYKLGSYKKKKRVGRPEILFGGMKKSCTF